MSSLWEMNLTRPEKLVVRKEKPMAMPRHEPASQQRKALAVGHKMQSLKPWGKRNWSGDTRGMSLPGLLKGRGLIPFLRLPNSIENARPDIGQGTDGDGMTLALGPLALVKLLRPRFLERALPSELLQDIAPGLDTRHPAMGLLVRPALEENRRCASQRLQTTGISISAAVIAHFGQQSRSKTCTSSWQSLEEFAVGMDQKKALNLLVVLGNLLEQRLQLVYQGQHQPRF